MLLKRRLQGTSRNKVRKEERIMLKVKLIQLWGGGGGAGEAFGEMLSSAF